MRARVGDVELGYDRVGAGDPVLLVMGLSTSRIGWLNQLPALAAHYDVTAFDNRGMGESDAPQQGWTMADMADDAVGLMDVLGHERVHLVGVSMGGMISQEMVLRHPERVRSLALISTHPGGPDAEWPDVDVMAALSPVPGAHPFEQVERLVRLTFGRRYQAEHPEIVEVAIEFAKASPPPEHGVINQMVAIMMWASSGGSSDRLGRIDVPTLILHGSADELIPVENAELLAKGIPGARLRIWEDAGHALIQERWEEVNQELLDHLAHA